MLCWSTLVVQRLFDLFPYFIVWIIYCMDVWWSENCAVLWS